MLVYKIPIQSIRLCFYPDRKEIVVVAEGFPFNDTTLVFKVAGKIFALLYLSEDSRGLNLKCDPELAIELREQFPEVTPAYHFSKIIILFKFTVTMHMTIMC